jgi:hypothetical protein
VSTAARERPLLSISAVADRTRLSEHTIRRRVTEGDLLELGRGELLPLRVVDLVETGPRSPLAALVKVSPAPMVVR